MHRDTQHTNGDPAAPLAPALARARTDSIETVLLSVEKNIIAYSGLKASYGEMFFIVLLWVMAHLLDQAGSTHIQMPTLPQPHPNTHAVTHTHTHTSRGTEPMTVGEKRHWIMFIFNLFCSLFYSIFSLKPLFDIFFPLSSLFLSEELKRSHVFWCWLKVRQLQKNILFFIVLNEMHIFFASSTHLT